MIYFDLKTKSFSELSNDNTYPIDLQDDINAISASITGGGAVWIENGKIKCSGKAPSPFHVFNMATKSFELSKEKQTALFAQQKEGLLNKLADKADQLKNGLLAGYPQTEIESFYRQEKEALAWQADHNTPTPMLSQIARVRGVPLDILISKVIEKSAQFAVAIGIIIGQRQAFEDRLLATKTLEELTALEKEIEEWKFQAN
nr:MAG TPA: hypothetical protein [Caudoviricetes sp.]